MYGRVQKRVLQAVNVRTSKVKRYVSHVIVIDMCIVFRAMAPAGDGCGRRDDRDMAMAYFLSVHPAGMYLVGGNVMSLKAY